MQIKNVFLLIVYELIKKGDVFYNLSSNFTICYLDANYNEFQAPSIN